MVSHDKRNKLKEKRMRKKIIITAVCLMLLAGCKGADNSGETAAESITAAGTQPASDAAETQTEKAAANEAQAELFAMDTYMTLTAYGGQAQEAVDAAAAEIGRLDSLLSTGDEKSEVYKLNAAGGGKLSADTAYLLERSLKLWEETDGALDIAIYPVMDAWGFTDQDFQVPEADTISSLLPLCDPALINYDKEAGTVTYAQEGMAIDFGAIAKGYTSLRVADMMKAYGIESGMINLGGNVQLIGSKTDGSPWRVGIQDPEAPDEIIGVLSAADKAVITSGGYERYFEADGKRYHHIIDPDTGFPAENGLLSVTIVSADGTLADALSTALFVMGPEKAAACWQEHADEFDAILITEDGSIQVTAGIAGDFTSDKGFTVIEKEE